MTAANEAAPGSPGFDPEELVLDLEGFEGPIGMLLALAREQKVDLKQISILALADQYLDFIAKARSLRLEIAGDYLVMAAWLAYLKSRLLLPEPQTPEEPLAADLAESLQWQLQRLEAMQQAAEALMARPHLNRDVFGPGAPPAIETTTGRIYAASLFELLRAYAGYHARTTQAVLQIDPPNYYSVDDALKRLSSMIGTVVEWRWLDAFLPPELSHQRRSVLAATFAASLEMAKDGRIELRQDEAFGPILIRAARPYLPRDSTH